MSTTFEEYCRKLQAEVDSIEQQAEADVRLDHLRAFNLGRSLERIEQSRGNRWLRVRWWLFGAAFGVSAAGVYLHVVLSARILHFTR
jgi:hypothetical protein